MVRAEAFRKTLIKLIGSLRSKYGANTPSERIDAYLLHQLLPCLFLEIGYYMLVFQEDLDESTVGEHLPHPISYYLFTVFLYVSTTLLETSLH